VHDGVGLVSSNVDCLIKSTDNIRPLNLYLSLANISGPNAGPGLINAPSYDPAHPFYPNLVNGSTAPTVPSDHSHIYISHIGCNHVHGGDVSQSRDT